MQLSARVREAAASVRDAAQKTEGLLPAILLTAFTALLVSVIALMVAAKRPRWMNSS